LENNNKLSLSDSDMLREDEKILNLLLKDHTTGKNIKWGTDSYINHGYSFRNDQEIKIDLITGWYEGFIRPRVDKDIDVQLERQRNRAEVFTPSWVIKLQVDAALKDMEELSLVDFIKTKWLEITCGEAPYMVNRYDMETGEVIPLKDRAGFIDVKFKKINEAIESEEEWLKLAVEIYKASYGYEYQGDSLLLARENLILTFIDNYFYMFGAFPKDKILLEITNIVGHNVFQMDGITYEVPYSDGGAEEFGTQLSLFEEEEVKEEVAHKLAKLKFWDKNKLIEFKTVLERNDSKMKFDVVIGNPPYQEEIENNARAKPIYNLFMDAAINLGNKSILITPGRFLYDAGQTPKSWNKKMLSSINLKILYYEENSANIFINTDIKGGVVITYYSQDDNFEPIGVFTPYKEMKNVVNLVSEYTEESSIADIVSTRVPYGLSSSFLKDKVSLWSNSQGEDSGLLVHGLLNGSRVLKPLNSGFKLNKGQDLVESYKVLVAKAYGSGFFGEAYSELILASPFEICTDTYLVVGDFTEKYMAENLT
jgi:type II restriction enzyme